MMISCPECGREISDKAVSCPNCGAVVGKKFCQHCGEKIDMDCGMPEMPQPTQRRLPSPWEPLTKILIIAPNAA